MEKLKPCPFCGGEVLLSYSSKGNFAFRHKHYCDCPFDEFDIWITPTKYVACLADAAEAWNRRAERSEDGETKQISAEFAKLMREGEIQVRWRE